MSGSTNGAAACECCVGPREGSLANRPGLPALRYRAGTHGSFLERMLRGLPVQTVPGGGRPLQELTTRARDDHSIALLDAAAVMLDVLTFYQERIANEGFLRTADERRSILELARAIGYELDPGVAATAWIAFTVEAPAVIPTDVVPPAQRPFQTGPGSTAQPVAKVPARTPIKSVPGPDETSQTYETAEELEARTEWNALRPRLTQPQPVDPGVAYVWVGGIITDVKAGAWVVFFTRDATNTNVATPRQVVAVTHDDANGRTRLDLAGATTLPVYVVPSYNDLLFALPTTASSVLNATSAGNLVVQNAWTNSDLNAFVAMQQWNTVALVMHLSYVHHVSPPPPPPSFALDPPEPGLIGFTVRSGPFGHNAPRWASLPAEQRFTTNGHAPIYPTNWDGSPPSIEEDSQGVFYRSSSSMGGTGDDAHFFFERVVPEVLPGSWVLLERRGEREVVRVGQVVEASLADFALSGRATGVLVEHADGTALEDGDLADFKVRATTLHAGSRPLPLVSLPIPDDIGAGTQEADQLTLDGLHLGIESGRAVIVTGQRRDLEGVTASEVLHVADVIHSGGFTTLFFESAMTHTYIRATVTLNANVVKATHGESVTEILGSGDAAAAGQRFILKRPPLTYVPSSGGGTGASSTLEVRVDDVLWEGRPSLYGTDERTQAYTVRHDDDANATVFFGDGRQGARLPTGTANVVARYRTGIGLEGLVGANRLTVLQAKPLGIRDATNPLPASGADDPETLDDARTAAPVTVRTLGRIVSLDDYADFARTYAGVGKASAHALWTGRDRLVAVTIGAASGDPVPEGDELRRNLANDIAAARAPLEPFRVVTFQPLFFSLAAQVAIDRRLVAEKILGNVRDALLSAFGYAARAFGQDVTAAEIIAAVHAVDGVEAVNLTALHLVTESPGATPASRLSARNVEWQDDMLVQAELLRINPAGIALTEMQP